MRFVVFLIAGVTLLCPRALIAQPSELDRYNVVWTTQSKNSGESMPCGGGDVGLNVWVEGGELLFYVARSGTFDENNSLLKLGRVRLRLSPNPFRGSLFRQELVLKHGNVEIRGRAGALAARIRVWVDVFRPVVHVEVQSSRSVSATVSYESWRVADRITKGKENNANSWKWAPQGIVKTLKDEVGFEGDNVIFYHRNSGPTVFDAAVKQQGLDSVKNQLYNPLKDLTFGGLLRGKGFRQAGVYEGNYLNTGYKGWKIQSNQPRKQHEISLYLYTASVPDEKTWADSMKAAVRKVGRETKEAFRRTQRWWKKYWERSFIFVNATAPDTSSASWQAGRNYQLFRYMLGCNAYGKWPTKFNGGLFTFDPSLTDSTFMFTPDFRNWGGGTHTAQNQRLVYWPMLKNGDTEMMEAQFQYYLRCLHNAELRSKVYWNHPGACFTEQLENFGLPNPAEYGWKRPATYDKGLEYNAWLEYEWDTVLEFCLMMLEEERYAGTDISRYLPFIESCLTFFNEHYQYLAKLRGSKVLDEDGHLIFYPGSGGETYKMAYNSTSTITGLRTVISRLLELPPFYLTDEKRRSWSLMLKRIPPINFREAKGYPTIAPAKLWERINNSESPQLYPVFPWGVYGIGKPGLDTAINTFEYDPDVVKFRSYVGWKQDNIFAARLGLSEEAARLTLLKLKDSGRRFPAFWGPGYDWTPDHNWGGTGMIGLQEMIMQCDGKKIYLLPACPSDWNLHFKLHAPYHTEIEGIVENGKVTSVKVYPESRRKDVLFLNR